MSSGQALPGSAPLTIEKPGLKPERLGPLPIISHFIDRLGLDQVFEKFVPTDDPRCRLSHAKCLGVLLRSIIVERDAIYRQHENVSSFSPEAFGLLARDLPHLADDAIGRALEHFFDADRGTLFTEIIVSAVQRFSIDCSEHHNDSTTIRFCGQYQKADGRDIRGRPGPFITYGFSKDHRPDLKQLLFILTTSADGGVPVQFRSEAGNASDSRSHEETWDALCRISEKKDFLYVADSKLCGGKAMDYIHEKGGRFVTVLPRSRMEDAHFRAWIQQNTPQWETVRDRVHPRRRTGPRDIWKVAKDTLPSKEGWPIIWVFSHLLSLRQEQTRREQLAKARQELEKLERQLEGKKPRLRSKGDIQAKLAAILKTEKLKRYLRIRIQRKDEHVFRQETAGRPGPETKYRRKTVRRHRLQWSVNEDKIEYDRKSDGMYPLLTNDRNLSPKEVLEAHKRQPAIEKRFQQTKSVFNLAPVFLKNPDRVEALFSLYFIALLLQALIERELRLGMKRREMETLPLYPEERQTKRPTSEQVLRLFSLAERRYLLDGDREVYLFEPELSELQKQVLALLGMGERAYCRCS